MSRVLRSGNHTSLEILLKRGVPLLAALCNTSKAVLVEAAEGGSAVVEYVLNNAEQRSFLRA
jgi:hypothetical protein